MPRGQGHPVYDMAARITFLVMQRQIAIGYLEEGDSARALETLLTEQNAGEGGGPLRGQPVQLNQAPDSVPGESAVVKARALRTGRERRAVQKEARERSKLQQQGDAERAGPIDLSGPDEPSAAPGGSTDLFARGPSGEGHAGREGRERDRVVHALPAAAEPDLHVIDLTKPRSRSASR